MTALSATSEYVSLTYGTKTIVLKLEDNDFTQFDHSTIILENISHKCREDTSQGDSKQNRRLKEISPDDDDKGMAFSTSDISPRGNLLAFCTSSKYLCIVKLEQKNIVISKVYQLKRGASKIRFTPKTENIVVADKSGDVYLFRIKEEVITGELVLGHLSLLLDVLVTSDEKFIITSDRDEKIRISSFPNGYNIIAYCLGHLDFVSSLGFLPHNRQYLFSTSGDSTLRFWDFRIGSELLVCNVLSHFSSDSPCSINNDGIAAITDSDSILIDDKTSLVCICVENLKMCVTLKCMSVDKKLQYSICQYIPFVDSNPWRVNISSNLLWIALNLKHKSLVKTMIFNRDKCYFEDVGCSTQIAGSVEVLNSQVTNQKTSIVDQLFKKKFDNVLEYLRKKDAKNSLISSEPSIKKIKC